MKKLLYTMSVIATALAFQSCGDNPNTVNPTSELGTATIKGTVYANTDATNTVTETAPAGVRIVAKVDTRELVGRVESGVNYAFKYYETVTDASGKYTFEKIEVGNRDINVTIIPNEFEADYKYKPWGDTIAKTEKRIYSESEFVVGGVYKGSTYFRDINY